MANPNALTALLSAEDLCLIRGERCLFRAVGFALDAGDVLQVEGANGAGKTSLLRLIAGLLTPESGEVYWNARPIREIAQEFRCELVWLGHKVGCKNELTPIENLRCEQTLRPQSPRSLADVVERLRLGSLIDVPMRSLSAGQQRRVSLARLLLGSARLWLLDEPLTNLDRDGRALVRDLIAGHLAEGGVCVVASHQSLDLGSSQQRLVLT